MAITDLSSTFFIDNIVYAGDNDLRWADMSKVLVAPDVKAYWLAQGAAGIPFTEEEVVSLHHSLFHKQPQEELLTSQGVLLLLLLLSIAAISASVAAAAAVCQHNSSAYVVNPCLLLLQAEMRSVVLPVVLLSDT